jgi:hypothetical protein
MSLRRWMCLLAWSAFWVAVGAIVVSAVSS